MIDLYVINIIERKDRWDNIVKTFNDPEYNLIKIEAIKHKNGWKGCFLSHKKCIQIAKDKNLENIIVLEDDCIPFDVNTFKKRLLQYKKYLDENNNWNIFLGGTVSINELWVTDIINFDDKNMVEMKKAYATHFICYNKNVYDLFLSQPITKPIDEFWHEKIKCIMPVPFIAKQLPGYSNIVNKNKSDEKRINDANNLLVNYIKNKK
jgi:GR25 family glycosyltransferase involved in LPS biosynthesis